MTIGIVLVACRAAAVAAAAIRDDDVRFALDDIMRKLRQPLRVAIGVAFLEQDGLAFDITELSQPIPEKRDGR
jgi:hypothetical protein